MIYLVRLEQAGQKSIMRDGKGLKSPMKDVYADRYVPFHNLPSGCEPDGGPGIEIIACKDKKEADAKIKDQKSRIDALIGGDLKRLEATKAKIKAQVEAGKRGGKEPLAPKSRGSGKATLADTVEESAIAETQSA